MKQTSLIMILLLCCEMSFANSFEDWKKDYIKRAGKRGIPTAFSKKILAKVNLNKEVIKKDRNQITRSKKLNYNEFMKKWLRNGERIALAKEMLKKHKTILDKVEKKYGVDKEVIVALWGIESLYGKITGDYNVIEALASLAYEGRRRKFYEIQLNAAMRLLRKGHVTFENFKGSWAGATGHCQFMPSNIPGFGRDFNKDGKVDLWNDHADIFASIAYLMKKNGWKKGKRIGHLTSKGSENNKQYSKISLKDSPMIKIGENYKPIIRWNRSSLFAAFAITITEEL